MEFSKSIFLNFPKWLFNITIMKVIKRHIVRRYGYMSHFVFDESRQPGQLKNYPITFIIRVTFRGTISDSAISHASAVIPSDKIE